MRLKAFINIIRTVQPSEMLEFHENIISIQAGVGATSYLSFANEGFVENLQSPVWRIQSNEK